MAGLEDAAEGEGAELSDHAAVVGGVGDEGRVPRAGEGGLSRPRDVQTDVLAAEPVARVIAVAVHQRDFHAVIEQRGQVRQLPAARVVAGAGEGLVDGVVGFGEVDGHAEGGLGVRLGEVAEEVVGREGVRVEGGDVVVVAAGGVDVGAFDLVAARVAGGDAGGVDGGVGAGGEGVRGAD